MAETTVTVVASKRESLDPYIKILQRSNDIDVSFSSYLKPNNNEQEDGELSIFDARKYFSEMGSNDTSKSQTDNIDNTTKFSSSKVSSFSVGHTVTASSEASWNSQTGLLANNNRQNGRKKGSFSTPKWLFRRRTCPCSSSKSVQIQEAKPRTVPDRMIHHHQTISSSDPVRLTIPSTNLTRSIDYTRSPSSFSFPTLYETSKPLDKPKNPVLNPLKPGNTEEEARSDASSDLFEIESFSTQQMSQTAVDLVRNSVDETGTEFGYAPSEASVTWSVKTAEPAAFCDKRRMGFLMSCRCEKAVMVNGGEGFKSRSFEEEEEVAEKVLCNNGTSKLSIMKRHELNNGGSFVSKRST